MARVFQAEQAAREELRIRQAALLVELTASQVQQALQAVVVEVVANPRVVRQQERLAEPAELKADRPHPVADQVARLIADQVANPAVPRLLTQTPGVMAAEAAVAEAL